jgi:hypothetical protein
MLKNTIDICKIFQSTQAIRLKGCLNKYQPISHHTIVYVNHATIVTHAKQPIGYGSTAFPEDTHLSPENQPNASRGREIIKDRGNTDSRNPETRRIITFNKKLNDT